MSNKSAVFRGLLRSDVLAAISVAGFVGILGLWPHLKFVHEIGDFRYFHGAYDEDTYVLSWFLGTLRATRALSGFALSAVYGLAARSLDATLIVSDFLFPFVATCAAYFAASQIVSGRSARILIALLLVFANDLLSLGNVLLWTSDRFNILVFSRLASLIHPNLVPSYETSFLAIFRTPEPQLSLALMFLTLGLLARLARPDQRREPGMFAATVAGISLLPIGYTFVTLPVATVAGGFMLVLAWFRRTSAVVIAVGLLGAVLVSLAAVYWDRNGGQTSAGLAEDLTYRTRLPILSPAIIGSLILGVPFGIWTLCCGRRQPLAFLALGCLIAPLLVSNQQLLTGMMFSARDWERTVHYPLLVFGGVAALSVMPFRDTWPRLLTPLLWVVSAVIVVVAVQTEKAAFAVWRSYNMESVAIARALEKIGPDTINRATLVFENAGVAVITQVRTRDRITPVLTFYRVAMKFIPNMPPEATSAAPSSYEPGLFEHWFRTGVSAEQAEQMLRSEIRQRAGAHLNYLFSFRDAWYPATDNRAVRQGELERSVGPVVDRYRNFLAAGTHCTAFERPALLVSARSPADLKPVPSIHNEHLATGAAGEVTAYVYRQSSREAICGGRD